MQPLGIGYVASRMDEDLELGVGRLGLRDLKRFEADRSWRIIEMAGLSQAVSARGNPDESKVGRDYNGQGSDNHLRLRMLGKLRRHAHDEVLVLAGRLD